MQFWDCFNLENVFSLSFIFFFFSELFPDRFLLQHRQCKTKLGLHQLLQRDKSKLRVVSLCLQSHCPLFNKF